MSEQSAYSILEQHVLELTRCREENDKLRADIRYALDRAYSHGDDTAAERFEATLAARQPKDQ